MVTERKLYKYSVTIDCMDKNIYAELEKTRRAFERVKEDVRFLSESIGTLEESKVCEIRDLKQEISFLKQRVFALEKKGREISKENLHVQEAAAEPSVVEKVVYQSGDEYRVVGNSDSLKFHYSNCPFAKKISDEHYVEFSSIKDALNRGYQTCSCVRDND